MANLRSIALTVWTGVLAAAVSAWPIDAARADIAPGMSAPLDLAAYGGKVVYLDFWASWCGPCRLSFPFMNELRRSFSKDDLAVVAVDVDRSYTAAQRFLKQQPADFPIVYDNEGKIAAKFNISEMPTSILIGKNGRVRYVHRGFYQRNEPLYRQHIAELLREN